MLKTIAIGNTCHVFTAGSCFGKSVTLHSFTLTCRLFERFVADRSLIRFADFTGLKVKFNGLFKCNGLRNIFYHMAISQVIFFTGRCFVKSLCRDCMNCTGKQQYQDKMKNAGSHKCKILREYQIYNSRNLLTGNCCQS